MDRGPSVSGKKMLIGVIGGLILFTLVSLFVTFFVGREFGHILNKKAMDHERDVQSQRMIDREAHEKH